MRPGWRGTLVRLLIVLAVFAAWLAYFAWSRSEQRRAVEALAPAERRMTFQSSLENFKRLCVERQDEALDAYCQHQRELLDAFPECDAACREVLARSEKVPTR